MTTVPILMRYRPVRIGWCVERGDHEALRSSIRHNFTLWGGRFNPIIPVDEPDLARRLVDLFRIDCLHAGSSAKRVTSFIEDQRHLPWPDHQGSTVIGVPGERMSAYADIVAPIEAMYEEVFKGKADAASSLLLHDCAADDPLGDVVLATFGGLPTPEETAEDYRSLLQLRLRAEVHRVSADLPLAFPDMGKMTLAGFNGTGLAPHHSIRSHWNHPGFYLGDAADFEDLVSFWNLRAAGTPLMFYDHAHADRLAHLKDQWLARLPQIVDPQLGRGHALWTRSESALDQAEALGEGARVCTVHPGIWNGLNVKAPVMIFGQDEILASIDGGREPPSTSFAIPNSRLNGGGYGSQRYVVTIEPGVTSFEDDRHTLHLPFLPALNRFYGRAAGQPNRTRSEPGALGIIVDGSDRHIKVRAVDTGRLFEAVFALAGITATPSAAGLVCSRLIHQMGGLDECRAFRIGGVRDLIEDYPPDRSFTGSAAKQAIRAQDTDHPLSGYQELHIEERPWGTRLKNDDVFAYLLRKEVFRPGLKLDCPNCRLDFWRSIDEMRTKAECEYCGHVFHIGPQLRDRDWAYRRSGLFGRNDNQEGAIPVVLTLQQLVQMHDVAGSVFGTAMSLSFDGPDGRPCETDFVFLANRRPDQRVKLAIGECKTRGPITEGDVQNLLRVAKAFPQERIDVFLIFSKLAAFTDEELALIFAANDEWTRRVIILTERELEPWYPYRRAAEEFGLDRTVIDLDGMADATHRIYFERSRGRRDHDVSG